MTYTIENAKAILQNAIKFYNEHNLNDEEPILGFLHEPVFIDTESMDVDLLESKATFGCGFSAKVNIYDSLLAILDNIKANYFELNLREKKTFVPVSADCYYLFNTLPFCVDISIADDYLGYRFKLYEL